MRNILTLLFFLICTYSFAQTKDCDCSAALNQNLKSKFTSTEYRDFKDWMYQYFKQDETTRSAMKSSARSSWGGKFSTVIDELPVKGGLNADKASSKSNQKYYNAEQTYMQNKYLTDEQFNQVIEEHFDINQLDAYKSCLDLCKSQIGNGISYITGGDLKDAFYIQITFNSISGTPLVTLKGDALYTNIEPINGLIFRDSLVIADRQSVTQYFKRLDPTKTASFTVNLRQNIKTTPITLEANPPVDQKAIPVGAIVASVLDYQQFLKANGLDQLDNSNMKIAPWVPCDGRILSVSRYAEYSGGKVPDLRGVFLRGINDYGVAFATVTTVPDQQKNPENKLAGEFQLDMFKAHDHGITTYYDKIPRTGGTTSDIWRNDRPTRTSMEGGAETRPKNVTVYYYIKIN